MRKRILPRSIGEGDKLDAEAAKRYTPDVYYDLLMASGYAGIVPVSICPEVVATMRPVVERQDVPYSDENGHHIIRIVKDVEGNIAYVDATHMDMLEAKHPDLDWCIALSLRDVLVASLSETDLLTLCVCNLDPRHLVGKVEP